MGSPSGQRPIRNQRLSRITWTACVVVIFAGALPAQESFGTSSNEPPNEDRYVYKQVPDIEIETTSGSQTSLAAFWQQKPVLLTMIFHPVRGPLLAISAILLSRRSRMPAGWATITDWWF